MRSPPQPAIVAAFDIEGEAVRYVQTADGRRLWLCQCEAFKERAARHSEGFCDHTAIAITWCVEDVSIEISDESAVRARRQTNQSRVRFRTG